MTYAQRLTSNPGTPYVVPFAVFLIFLALQRSIPLPPVVEGPLRLILLAGVLYVFSRHVIDLHANSLFASTLVGIAVFAIWILPDMLYPAYRQYWLFQNALTGPLSS